MFVLQRPFAKLSASSSAGASSSEMSARPAVGGSNSSVKGRVRVDEPLRAGDLLLKIVGQVVRPVVVPQPPPAEAFADTLAEGLQGLEAGPVLGGMQTDALGRAVVNGLKHPADVAHQDLVRARGDARACRRAETLDCGRAGYQEGRSGGRA